MLQTRNVHVSHSGPSDQLDLGSNHRSVCAHCKSDAINVKTANQAQMVVQGVCAEIPSCNCGKLTLPNSAKHIESIVVPCANAAAKEPHTHHPTPLQQPHFQSPLDLRRGCRDKRERCCLSFFPRSFYDCAKESGSPCTLQTTLDTRGCIDAGAPGAATRGTLRALSPFGDRNHGTVTRCGGMLRAPVACQWGHERDDA